MKKSNTENPISTEIKLDRKNKRYNFKFTRIKKGQKKYLESSPEKECSSINELVKRSVEKINNLFQQHNISETNDKNININPPFINNRVRYRENQNFHTINSKEDLHQYDIINKNDIAKNDEDLSENLGQNINSCVISDVSAIKRNVKQHSFDFKKLFKSIKDSKNQIDYIQKSNQNEKKYVIQNIESYQTLFNPKTTINLQNSQNDEYSPLRTKKNYLFQSEIIKDLSNEQNLLNQNLKTNQQNRRNKYFSFYRNNNSKKNGTRNNKNKNSLKSKINNNIINSIQKQNSNKYFETNYKRTFSMANYKENKFKENKNKRYNYLRKNKTSNSLKNSTKYNFSNTKIQNINQIKIYASPSTLNNKKEKFRSKTQSHFSNVNSSQILKQFYSKEFPSKTKANDILKLMLFLNEYIINNNLLDDYYIKKNRKILDDYSKFLISNISLNYPKESDAVLCNDFVNKTKIIQRNWRKIKVEKFLEIKKLNEVNEMKKFVINEYIEKAGYQTKKFFGIFHNLLEQFTSLEKKDDLNPKENNLNKCFYFLKKIMNKNLSTFEKNELYKDYINKVIFLY